MSISDRVDGAMGRKKNGAARQNLQDRKMVLQDRTMAMLTQGPFGLSTAAAARGRLALIAAAVRC